MTIDVGVMTKESEMPKVSPKLIFYTLYRTNTKKRNIIFSNQAQQQYSFTAQILEQNSRDECKFKAINTVSLSAITINNGILTKRKGDIWAVLVQGAQNLKSERVVNLSEVRFRLVNEGSEGQVLENCKVIEFF